LAGCSGDTGVQEDDATTDLRQIARAYDVIITQTQKPPRDLEQIRTTIADLHLAQVIDEPTKVLTSYRHIDRIAFASGPGGPGGGPPLAMR